MRAYLDFASLGTLSLPTTERMLDDLRRYTLDGPKAFLKERGRCFDDCRKLAADLLSCEPRSIAYVPNASTAVLLVLSSMGIKPKETILLLGNHFGNIEAPIAELRRLGVHCTSMSTIADLPQFLEERHDIRAVFVTWVAHRSGEIQDLHTVSKLCKQFQVPLIVDASQGLGTRRLSVQTTPIDVLIANCSKHLRALPGTALMYVSPHYLAEPPLHGYKAYRYLESGAELETGAARFHTGTRNLFGVLSLEYSLCECLSKGISSIEEHNLELLAQIRSCLGRAGIEYETYVEQGNIIPIAMPNAEIVQSMLEADGIYIKAFAKTLRLSFHHDTDMSEVEAFINACPK